MKSVSCLYVFVIHLLKLSVEGVEQKQTACYDIDVEVDDTLKAQMNNFLLSTASQQEIQVFIYFITSWVYFFFLFYLLNYNFGLELG